MLVKAEQRSDDLAGLHLGSPPLGTGEQDYTVEVMGPLPFFLAALLVSMVEATSSTMLLQPGAWAAQELLTFSHWLAFSQRSPCPALLPLLRARRRCCFICLLPSDKYSALCPLDVRKKNMMKESKRAFICEILTLCKLYSKADTHLKVIFNIALLQFFFFIIFLYIFPLSKAMLQ